MLSHFHARKKPTDQNDSNPFAQACTTLGLVTAPPRTPVEIVSLQSVLISQLLRLDRRSLTHPADESTFGCRQAQLFSDPISIYSRYPQISGGDVQWPSSGRSIYPVCTSLLIRSIISACIPSSRPSFVPSIR